MDKPQRLMTVVIQYRASGKCDACGADRVEVAVIPIPYKMLIDACLCAECLAAAGLAIPN